MKCPVCQLSEAVVYINEGVYGCVKCGVAFTSTGVIFDDDWSLDEKSSFGGLRIAERLER